MATVGQSLVAPESGWKRYDDDHPAIKRVGTWSVESSTSEYGGSARYSQSTSSSLSFDFSGSKLRLIAAMYTNQSNQIEVLIDGSITRIYSAYSSTLQYQVIVLEETNLSPGRHTVKMRSLSAGNWLVDAIDIDSIGRLYHPDEVTDVLDLKIGKRIRCHYTAPLGSIGSFNSLGMETSDFIPSLSSSTPNGDFYWIMTEDFNNKRILVADRNIQHSISWDTINNAGIASGGGLPSLALTNGAQSSIRLSTGGVTTTDTDNEWDRYIVKSNLNGSITAGDNNIWNFNTVSSMTSSTVSGVSANRYSRGYATVSSFYSYASSYVTPTVGFRPVMEVNKRYGQADFTSTITIPYRQNTQQLSTIIVPPNGYMTGKVDITPLYWLNTTSIISVKNVSNSISYITVPPHNKMAGIVDVYPPPITSVEEYPLQDAFVRSAVPKLNYGIEQEMLVGKNSTTNEMYLSLFKFDISSIPINQKIKKATVNLYFDYEGEETPTIVSMYELLESWSETGVTWANRPAMGALTNTFETPLASGYISVDVKDMVDAWYKGDKINNGWILNTDSVATFRFYTKERLTDKPFLLVEYYDPVAKSIGHLEMSSSVTVIQHKYMDRPGSITVRSGRRIEDFSSHLHVLNKDMLETSVTINKPEMPSTISIRRNTDNILGGSLTVRQKTSYDFDSVLQVSRSFIASKLTVRRNDLSKLTSSINVRGSESANFNSLIGISRPQLLSSLSVVMSHHFPSTVTVKSLNDQSVTSQITVRRSESTDLNSTVNVWKPSILQSSIFIISGYLSSNIIVPFRANKDISSTIYVREKYASDLMSVLGVYQFSSIPGEIQIVQSGGNVGFVIII